MRLPKWLHWLIYLAFLAIIAAWPMLSGCQSDKAGPLTETVGAETYVGDGIAPGYRVSGDIDSVALETAITKWNEVAGRDLFATDHGYGQVTIILEDFETFASKSNIDPGVLAYAEWSDFDCTVHVMNQGAGPYLWQVYAHELGHCLGFGHSHYIYSLMSPTLYIGLNQDFTDDLIELFFDNDLYVETLKS